MTRIGSLELLAVADGLLVVLVADDGTYGLGEIGMRHRMRAVEGLLWHLRETVVGADVWDGERLWQRLRRGQFFPAVGDVAAAMAGVDIALWDLRGKLLRAPVYQLFGGRCRDRVACYTHVNDLASARAAVERGYTHLRVSVEPPAPPVFEPRAALRRTVARMTQLREALGDDVELLLDVHTRLDPAEATVLCRELEPVRPYFVEDPLRCENPEAYRLLRHRSTVPLAAGEQYTSPFEFRPLIEGDLVDYARVDVANTGLTDARKIAAMAEAHHIHLVAHNPLGPVTAAASLQLHLTVPNAAVCELAFEPNDYGGLFTRLPRFDGGALYPDDTAAGIGVELDLERARAASRLTLREAPQLHRADGAFTNW